MNKIATTEEHGGALFVHPNPIDVLLNGAEFDKFYDGIKREVSGLVPDLTTAKGRQEIASVAYKVARTKTFLDEAGKRLNEEARAGINKVDASRRTMRQRLDDLRDEVRRPLTEWEDNEKARLDTVEAKMTYLRNAATMFVADDTSETISERLAGVQATEITEAVFQEETPFAEKAKQEAIEALTGMLERIRKEEADREELARLRAEQERRAQEEADRAAKEAAEKAETERIEAAAEAARVEAERKAEAERQAAAEAHERALQAEREAKEKVEREAREAEAARKAEAKRLAEEQAAREADKKHRSAVMKAAKEAMMSAADISEEQAKKVVLAILAGEIPNVTLRF